MAAMHPLHQDPTLRAILRDILEAPDDDGPRLVYADRVEDLGDYDLAEFIRVQVALAALGEERAIALNVVLRSHGPDYWTANLDSEVMGRDGPHVGQRVDVVPYRWAGSKGKGSNVVGLKKDARLYGLLITKIIDRVERSDYRQCVLKRDKDSLPWAGEPLRQRQNELLPDRRNLARWCPEWVACGEALVNVQCHYPPRLIYNHDGGSFFCANYRRGFVESITTRLQTFLQRAHDIFTTHPVQEVRLFNTGPDLHRVADENGGYTEYICRANSLPVELLGSGSHTFRTRDEADRWLSARCVAYGQSLR